MRYIDLVKLICSVLDKPEPPITFVTDRMGYDMRCVLDPEKMHTELG